MVVPACGILTEMFWDFGRGGIEGAKEGFFFFDYQKELNRISRAYFFTGLTEMADLEAAKWKDGGELL